MEYASIGDDILVKLLTLGDKEAFEEIYRRYWRKLFQKAQRKVYAREIVEELVQDIFINLWEKRATVQIQTLEPYLFTALKYQIISHIRKQLQEEKFAAYAATERNEEINSLEETIAYHDLSESIQQAMEQMPEKTRHIFRLNRLEGKSTREIVEMLNIPERTVEYHISQSLRFMREHLKEFLTWCLLFFLK
ncbi:RNA polymerase sigma-70 factor [Emticicia sp. 21SJ11W-3]|uniref:RNA polymerase sigma-70 factor n=1 Tax=Emticicia sp. 21SJ11W-3 TaxID=2916755 RepID=UPI0020A1C4B0|nr:RNA polymerase sigma-70 factor [Emticicia sp. 21SJ11W-3]UTA66326.1 RNA polymerase sigma-70 factor [Emticicia sp. 21SJ11W-3]